MSAAEPSAAKASTGFAGFPDQAQFKVLTKTGCNFLTVAQCKL